MGTRLIRCVLRNEETLRFDVPRALFLVGGVRAVESFGFEELDVESLGVDAPGVRQASYTGKFVIVCMLI